MINLCKYFICLIVLTVIRQYSPTLDDNYFFVCVTVITAIYMIKNTRYNAGTGSNYIQEKGKNDGRR